MKQSDVCGHIVAGCCLILQGFYSSTVQQLYCGAAPVHTEAVEGKTFHTVKSRT